MKAPVNHLVKAGVKAPAKIRAKRRVKAVKFLASQLAKKLRNQAVGVFEREPPLMYGT